MQLEKLNGKVLEQFFEAILLLENKEECYKFFDDLCTTNEVHLVAQRLEVARLLEEGYTYQKIEAITGASTATISRVKRSVSNGNHSYDFILNRLNKEEVKN